MISELKKLIVSQSNVEQVSTQLNILVQKINELSLLSMQLTSNTVREELPKRESLRSTLNMSAFRENQQDEQLQNMQLKVQLELANGELNALRSQKLSGQNEQYLQKYVQTLEEDLRQTVQRFDQLSQEKWALVDQIQELKTEGAGLRQKLQEMSAVQENMAHKEHIIQQ